jgi:hypothetical protein
MTTFNVRSFWPFWTTKQLRRFDYKAIDGSMPPMTSVFSYDVGSGSMLLDDYDAKGVWKDKWYYRLGKDGVVDEWRDDYPGKKIVMSPGIGWGSKQEIGSTYINYPQMSWYQCWPPAISKGCQICAFEAMLPTFKNTVGTYKNVLQFTYLQSWDSKPATGARYWMPEGGIGPVSLQWLAQDPKDPYGKPIIQTARMDAIVTTV